MFVIIYAVSCSLVFLKIMADYVANNTSAQSLKLQLLSHFFMFYIPVLHTQQVKHYTVPHCLYLVYFVANR